MSNFVMDFETSFLIQVQVQKMEKYNIGWNTHPTHLVQTSTELYVSKQFADVTLVSDDMIQTMAHRTVLSGASDVFKKLLLMNTGAQPLLYLKGVRNQELESILEFIYLGVAKVNEDRINAFTDVALELDIKELNKSRTKNEEAEESVNSEEKPKSNRPIVSPEMKSIEEASYKKNFISQNITSLASGNSICTQCDKSFSNSANLRRHIQVIHEQSIQREVCQLCDKTFSSNENLARHKRSIHLKVKYDCDQCGKGFSDSGNLSRHIKLIHV